MNGIELYQNAIFDSINMGIFVVDGSGKVRMWNDWLAKHARVTTDQALGKSVEQAFLQVPSAAFMTAIKNTLQYGLPAVLSNALHRAPLALYAIDEPETDQTIHQSITITALNLNDGQRCALIQVSDSSTSIKREKMLRSHSEVLKKDATTDILTGLYNRRFFDEHYKIAIGQAIRQKWPMTIFMVDIDYFKQYNDYYGHPAGDKVLVSVAQTLKSQLSRSSDMLARYGGEEFILILPNMQAENGMQFAEKLINAVGALNLPHLKSKAAKNVTISIGLSTYDPSRHREVTALIDAADTALYKAKQQGRNRASFLALDTLISHRVGATID
ncbi:MAG: sensor domain-containing diguanylate cyclase [Burkholderiaceae bacterium]|nr:MAG: sensor domain-containing diguanylate cyclase [Burkholderiaceae bacterium]